MFRVVSSGRLRRYADKIATYVNRCPDAWGVIYQADVRTRGEQFPIVLVKAQDYHAKAVVRNWDSEFVPEKPWEEVFRRILDCESDWWYDLIEIRFQSIVPGAAKPSKFIGNDAITRAENLGRGSDEAVPLPPPPAIPEGYTLVRKGTRTRQDSEPSGPPPKKGRVGDQHPMLRGGVYVTTRNGRPVCDGFNDGNCEACDQWGRCSRDGSSAHQCNLCLMVGHGAHQQRLCPKQGGGGRQNPGRGGGGNPGADRGGRGGDRGGDRGGGNPGGDRRRGRGGGRWRP